MGNDDKFLFLTRLILNVYISFNIRNHFGVCHPFRKMDSPDQFSSSLCRETNWLRRMDILAGEATWTEKKKMFLTPFDLNWIFCYVKEFTPFILRNQYFFNQRKEELVVHKSKHGCHESHFPFKQIGSNCACCSVNSQIKDCWNEKENAPKYRSFPY